MNPPLENPDRRHRGLPEQKSCRKSPHPDPAAKLISIAIKGNQPWPTFPATIANAKARKESAGKLVVVVGDNAAVTRTIKTTCADALLPMFKTTGAAGNSFST